MCGKLNSIPNSLNKKFFNLMERKVRLYEDTIVKLPKGGLLEPPQDIKSITL